MLTAFSISPQNLWSLTGTPNAPQIIDARRSEVYAGAPTLLPGAVRHEPNEIDRWIVELDRKTPIVVACKAGHEMSQSVTARLRSEGFDARSLEGGYGAWSETKLPLLDKAALERLIPNRPSVWVTRRKPKIDRVACPWLIRRFIDPQARFLFVDPQQVLAVAEETRAIPFDVEGVALSHVGERCSFDTILSTFGLESEASLAQLALIVRGADTARPELAPQAAGLLAISLGLSRLAGEDDHWLLERGFPIYDSLYAWLRFAADERHTWTGKV